MGDEISTTFVLKESLIGKKIRFVLLYVYIIVESEIQDV